MATQGINLTENAVEVSGLAANTSYVVQNRGPCDVEYTTLDAQGTPSANASWFLVRPYDTFTIDSDAGYVYVRAVNALSHAAYATISASLTYDEV